MVSSADAALDVANKNIKMPSLTVAAIIRFEMLLDKIRFEINCTRFIKNHPAPESR